MEKETTSINLLKRQKVNLLDQFFTWALTLGRVVVILTEGIAISAFLYRFLLDRELIDLKDKIRQKEARISVGAESEAKFRNLQGRLLLAGKLDTLAKEKVDMFTSVIKLAPPGLALKTVSISTNKMRIDANTQSIAAFTSFVNSLRDLPFVESVSLDKIENKTTAATISVAITATTKAEPVLILQ